ncbi:MAG: glycosyltransferase family 4 protein [Ignavibacteria bacterium]|nr:glycosyltransferase family 4 protein [Ignavibacteria bacterium]
MNGRVGFENGTSVKQRETQASLRRIAFVGNYLPRQCGIATFTTDLCEAVAATFDETACIALPVNDIKAGYPYPARVRFEIDEKDIHSYGRAADFLNINNVDLVCVQFEYGIFGGKAGGHVLKLLRDLRMPIVTTLHTILNSPTPDQKRVLEEVAALSDRLIVMSERGSRYLQDIYHVMPEKIDLIPHGIPDVPFTDPSSNKGLFGVEGKTVLLTFGLLSANKGIETVISALPDVVDRYPEVVYIVVGTTHPHVIQHEGETYRLSLQLLAKQKGVERHVIFYNRFVSLEELTEFIGAADIYITPYLNETQITSGTLAFAVGAGKAVISTPYWYAQEMLADGRGALVPFRDSEALAGKVKELLKNEPERQAMRKRAYMFGRSMIWSQVAKRYMKSFERARAESRHYVPEGFIGKALDKYPGELPPLRLYHLRTLTDETGILQHALFTVPNYSHGYTTDDNARALLVTVLLDELGNHECGGLSSRYLAFLAFAFNGPNKRFRNFMDYQRRWLEEVGSDDSQGRAMLALGTVLGRSTTPSFNRMAGWLFEQALPSILETTSPRAWAFALAGISEYSRRYPADPMALRVSEELGSRLLRSYQCHRAEGWYWFEKKLTYCNAALPHALLICGRSLPNSDMTDAGMESLRWLVDLQDAGHGHFVPIGSNGFYQHGNDRARFDQQPVEAQATVSACLEAFRITGDKYWISEARTAFEWFLGRNDLNIPVYDATTGGCRDGLHPDRPNENQGAESTLAFLQSLLELRLEEQTHLSTEALSTRNSGTLNSFAETD